MPGHADVLPSAAAIPAERLDRGLARGEPPGVGLGRPRLGVAVRDLLRREDAVSERGVARDRALHARDLADVDAQPDDLHATKATRRRWRELRSRPATRTD